MLYWPVTLGLLALSGLGLGLSIVASIAESHGGSLRFRRGETAGLTASLVCPLADPKETP